MARTSSCRAAGWRGKGRTDYPKVRARSTTPANPLLDLLDRHRAKVAPDQRVAAKQQVRRVLIVQARHGEAVGIERHRPHAGCVQLEQSLNARDAALRIAGGNERHVAVVE